MKRIGWPLVVISITAVLLVALMRVRYAPSPHATESTRISSSTARASSGYADPTACSTCHQEIARTYALTGMARAFSPVSGSEFKTGGVYHKASDRYYTMVQRDGKFYQRRHQIGFDGKETNTLELEADFVIGSGNHARTFLHRGADGRLIQLPVSWYAERGGYWAMSPGYDRPAHLDFRRAIDTGCMSCHNGYPKRIEDDGDAPRFRDPLPAGIDCQRCHGPGQAHVDAASTGNLEAARRAIVNPAALDRERQLETCMQCHLESTSSPLPFQIRRYEHAPFSYTPGKALGDFFIHFDHAPGGGNEDKFEIAGGAYRLRKSACFQRSAMTCGTCHDPHDIRRGPEAVKRYVAVCESCHTAPHPSGTPQARTAGTRPTCLECHMPKRRTDDAVHVVMTDHYIQRQRASRDLLAERAEADSLTHRAYRGEVVPYYPRELPATPENELYLAVAQVQQGSNLTAGIPRLQDAIERHRPTRAEFYYELARAYSAAGDREADIRWSRQALRIDSNFLPALKELAAATTAAANFPEAAQALAKAIALRPTDANALADLANVYLRQGRADEAYATAQRAVALDPALPLAHNTMGLSALRKGSDAEAHFREAIRLQPDLAEAHNNLGNLLAGRREYREAAHHFEKAIGSDPKYVEARHSYGVVLALMEAYPRAAAELEAVVRLAPQLAQAHLDLADVLVSMGRVDEAAREFRIAANASDASAHEAARAGLRALGR